MHIKLHATIASYVAQVVPFLLTHEASNNLMLGLCSELTRNPSTFGLTLPIMYTVHTANGLRLAALQTPPHNLILSTTTDQAAIEQLASTLNQAGNNLPGVIGPRSTAQHFAAHWAHLQSCTTRVAMDQRIFQLTEVQPPPPVTGAMRPATEADRPLLMKWFAAFQQEALPTEKPSDHTNAITNWLTNPNRLLTLWVTTEPVAMAGATGPTLNGIRINAVYTPPGKRRRGYASALVAALSQAQLDAGRRFCFLYTDVSNPTSNHIYQAIGYRPVSDSIAISFGDPG